jgi:phytoene dehydrogenase-like protein
MTTYDVIIVGAGHNGLVCAAYLGMAGLKVKVLERRAVVGGACVTEEFSPGFRNSTAAYTVSLLHPQVIHDLDLFGRGLKIVERRTQNFLPTPEGRCLLAGEGRTQASLARLSQADAARLAPFNAELDAAADLLRRLVLQPPPNPTRSLSLSSIREWLKLGAFANRLRRAPSDALRALFDLFTKSAGDYLDRWFESDPIKALFGFDAIVGNYASPYAPGTAYVLLHHAIGEVNGKKRTWGHAIGGMGAISEAIARACRDAGVEIEINAPVREVIIDRGRAAGVVLANGKAIRSNAIAANVNPKLLYTSMIANQALDPAFLGHMRNWRCASGTFRMNLALSELPSFIACPGHDLQDHHTAGIILGPSLHYMDRAYCEARLFGWSRAPVIEMVIPSTLDDSLARPGAHVASLFCQYVAPQLPDGASWTEHREQVADLMIDTVERYAPGFRSSIIDRQAFSPFDLEQVFGLLGGDIFHGALALDQLFWARPAIGYAHYRGPVAGLYHCGSGAHPGGGVTGAPGHNAARAILEDWRGRSRNRARV